MEKREPLLHCWWKWKFVQPLWKTVWRFFRKLKIELLYDPAIPFLGLYPDKIISQKDTCTHVFIGELFTVAKIWKKKNKKKLKFPLIDECIKIWYIYTTEYYSAIENNKMMPFVAI